MLFLPMTLAVFLPQFSFIPIIDVICAPHPPFVRFPSPPPLSPALPRSGLQEMISRKTGSSFKAWSRSGHVKKIFSLIQSCLAKKIWRNWFSFLGHLPEKRKEVS